MARQLSCERWSLGLVAGTIPLVMTRIVTGEVRWHSLRRPLALCPSPFRMASAAEGGRDVGHSDVDVRDLRRWAGRRSRAWRDGPRLKCSHGHRRRTLVCSRAYVRRNGS